jgi:hypothetical protein
MECRDAQFYLRLKRHAADELGLDVNASLADHLATCAACSADARAAASFDRAMASAMRAVPVPAGLRDQLVRHVASKQGASLRRKLYQAGALAAAALVFLVLGLSLISTTRPRVDTDALVQTADDQKNNPKEYTKKWLAAQKLPAGLPWDFDYDLLTSCGYEKPVKGSDRTVPVVNFRAPVGNGFAKVYIFRASEFDLGSLQDAQASHFQAEVVIGQDAFRGVTYVVVHSGGPNEGLNLFLVRVNAGGMMQL